jgi:hypothetical protein
MGSVNYIHLKETPKALADWTPMLASNATHLAHILKRKRIREKADTGFVSHGSTGCRFRVRA